MNARPRVLSLLLALGLPACVFISDGDSGGGSDGGADLDENSDEANEGVADCEDDCEMHLFFDCIDADQHEMCRARCQGASETELATFGACSSASLPNCEQANECIANFMDVDGDDGDSSGGSDSSGSDSDTGGSGSGSDSGGMDESG